MDEKMQAQPGMEGAYGDPSGAGSAGAGQQQGQNMAQPQAGALYQYVPGAGFVQVQAAPQAGQAMGAPQGMTETMGAAQGAMGAAAPGADAAMSGMYGQGMPEGAQPKFDQNKIGQMYGVVNDFMNGEADPAKIAPLLQNTGEDFWKGAVVGAVGAFILGNESVRNAIAGVFGSVLGGKEKDPEGPQVTVGEEAEA